MEKYVNEDTIIKTKEYESFQELLFCPICFNLMLEPVMCSVCQNHYCKSCIESWKKKNESCPNKCENSFFMNIIEKNRAVNKFKYKCIKGCGAEIPFNEINDHYSSNCLANKTDNKKSKVTILTKSQASEYQKDGKSLEYMTSKINYLTF